MRILDFHEFREVSSCLLLLVLDASGFVTQLNTFWMFFVKAGTQWHLKGGGIIVDFPGGYFYFSEPGAIGRLMRLEQFSKEHSRRRVHVGYTMNCEDSRAHV